MSRRRDEVDPGEIEFSPGLTDPTSTWRWDSITTEVGSDDSDSDELDLSALRTVHTTTTTYLHPVTNTPITHRVISNRPITQPEEATMSLPYNPSRDSDVDRRDIEALDEATAIFNRYVTPTGIYHAVGFDSLVLDFCAKRGYDASDDDDRMAGVKSLQNVLKERCVNADLRVAEVYLDLDDPNPNPRTQWMSTDTDRIVFTQILAADELLKTGTGGNRWIAVYWSAEDAPMIYRKDKYTGEFVQRRDTFAGQGYLAIVGTYPGLPAAEEAAAELAQAVRTIAHDRSGSALEPDTLDETWQEPRQRPVAKSF